MKADSMRLLAIVALLVIVGALPALGGEAGSSLAIASISESDLSAHVWFLASDELEGRASGTAGANVAAAYLAAALQRTGIEPAGDAGSYFQNFERGELKLKNVAGILRGADPALRREIVIVGAHYDHVGRGEFGSAGGSAARGEIHNGADDNASGTAVVLELAEAFTLYPPRRSILFLFFTGEEMGLVGSRYYAEHPLFPLEDTIAMINLDMVGRSRDAYLFIGGVGTAPVWKPMISRLNEDFGFRLEMKDGGRAPSDNSSFYNKKIPVLFFFTNVHEDYHRPGDDWEKLNFDGARDIARFVFRVVDELASAPARPEFVDTGNEYALPDSMRSSGRFRAGDAPFLGVQFARRGGDAAGVPVESVVSGSPAEAAGLAAGDRILSIDGDAVNSSSELSAQLRSRKVGDTVKLRVQRGEETLEMEAALGTRPAGS
jgi:hypothetical protein